MGKATRWLKGLLGIKRSEPNSKQNATPTPPPPHSIPRTDPSPRPRPSPEKRRWSFVKSYREKSRPNTVDTVPVRPQSGESPSDYSGGDPNKHAIAVAAASAAAAEAAVAAAKAAAVVVRLTNSGRSNNNVVRVVDSGRDAAWAAVVIQSHFRGYLARRALRALKGLVKLQALVRGHIMRKKASETMRCMQAMLRAQARARAGRGPPLPGLGGVGLSPHSSSKSSTHHHHRHPPHPGPPTPEKFERASEAKKANNNRDQSPLFKRNSSRSSGGSRGQDQVYYSSSVSDMRTEEDPTTWDHHHRGDKILEIDPGKPSLTPPKHHHHRKKNLYETTTSSHSGVSSRVHSCTTTSWDSTPHQQATISPTSIEVVQPQPQQQQQLPHSLNPLKFAPFTTTNYDYNYNNEEDGEFCTAENSPQFYSMNSSRSGASSRRGGLGAGAVAVSPFTPTKSDGSFSGLSGYSDCPSYMACTESSRAKMRSLSAPRQRPNYEHHRTSSSMKRWSAHHHGFAEARSSSQIIRGSDHLGLTNSSSALLHSGFVGAGGGVGGKGYPGSGRLDRLGMPVVKDNTVVYYSGYLN